MSKIVLSIDHDTGAETPLAEFRLAGEGTHAVYHSPLFQREMERDGIWLSGIGRLRPSDGQKFLDGLSKYYARSSTTIVKDNDKGAK